MGSADKFCLHWNDFESNISSAFRELREDKDFFDVTLACDDDQIQAHKVIISACSPFFRSILRRNRHEHPLLYLKGVKYVDLVSVLNFMYHGEVNVAQEELNSFLAVAKDLKVKGLTQISSDTKPVGAQVENNELKIRKASQPAQLAPPPKRLAKAPASSRPLTSAYNQPDNDIQEVVHVKSEPTTLPPEPDHTAPQTEHEQPYTAVSHLAQEDHAGGVVEYGDYKQEDVSYDGTGMGLGQERNKEQEEMMEPHIVFDPVHENSKPWQCTQCQQTFKQKCHVKEHIEGTHMVGLSFSCPYCSQEIGSRGGLRQHISRKHREEHRLSKLLPEFGNPNDKF